jgi:hypothetical protein
MWQCSRLGPAVAERERSLIVERVKAGIRNARAKGKKLGRAQGPNPRLKPFVHLGLAGARSPKRWGLGFGSERPTESDSGVPEMSAGPFPNGSPEVLCVPKANCQHNPHLLPRGNCPGSALCVPIGLRQSEDLGDEQILKCTRAFDLRRSCVSGGESHRGGNGAATNARHVCGGIC